MKRFKINDPNNINDFPEFNHIEQRVTKVELCFIDGSIKEAKLYFPFFTLSSEASEITNVYLSALINHWTRYWLKIKSYKIALGCVYKNGTEEYNVSYSPEEIPVDKVYIQDWPGGKWVSPLEEQQREQEKRVQQIAQQMERNKNPISGEVIKHEPVKFASYLN